MTAASLAMFRQLAAAMTPEPTDWQWMGPHMSQRMFGITRTRAEQYAQRHGGTAQPMTGRGAMIAPSRTAWVDAHDHDRDECHCGMSVSSSPYAYYRLAYCQSCGHATCGECREIVKDAIVCLACLEGPA